MAVTSVSGLTNLWTNADGAWTTAAVAGAVNPINQADTVGGTGIDASSAPLNLSSNGTNQPAGLASAYTTFSSVDISGAKQHIVAHVLSDSTFVFTSTAADGVRIALLSGGGTTEYATWNLGGVGDPVYAKDSIWKLVQIGLDAPDSSTGGYDNTDITGIAILLDQTAAGNFFLKYFLDQVVYVDSEVVIEDGEVANPANWDEVHDIIKETSTDTRRTKLFRRGGIGYESYIGFRNTATYWRSDTRAIGFVDEDDIEQAYPASFFNMDTVPPASGDIDMSTTLVGTGNTTVVDMDIDETNGKIVFNTNTIKDINLVDITGGDLSSSTLSGNQVPIEIASPTTGSWSVQNSVAGGIKITGGFGNYSSLAVFLDSSIVGDEIKIADNPAGTYDLTGITADHSINIHNESATSAITVTLQAGVTATSTTAGGVVTIASPTDDFTINSSEAGSTIRVFTTGTQTLLDSGTGSSLVFTHTGQTIDYTVQKAGFIPQRFTGQALSGTSSVTVNLVASREYDASHGLIYTTDASWSRSLNQLTVPTYGVTGQGVFSLMLDSFIAETSLYNTAFNLEMDGSGSLYLVDGAEGASDASIENIIRCGVGYLDSSGTPTAEWVSVLSIGDNTAGTTGEYQQVDGSGTTDARATGDFDETIKMYGDGTHGNFDYRGHLVFKYQRNGYTQTRVDVLDLFGITSLEPTLYVLPMTLTAISAATGDPAISITITDHTAAPITKGGELFDYEVVDNGTNSAESILREINYNLSLDATYQGKDPFNWPDITVEEGASYATVRGLVEGQGATTTLHGFYVSRGGADHPSFTRFQANNGNYYTIPTSDDLVVNSSETGSQIIVFSTGTQTVIDSAASASSLTYTHSSETVDITVMKAGFLPFRQTGVVLSGDVTIQADLIVSREYDASHGLTYTTDASWSRSLNELTVPTFGVTARGVFSLLLDSFISEAALRNTAFNLEMDGGNSLYLVNDAEGASDTDIENMIEAGVGYISTAGADTAQWSGVKSVGTATGFTGEYQQVDGSGTADARASGIFNELIKVYGDASHGNFDYRGHLVLKYQINGYYQARADVLDSFGITTLAPTLYIVAMEPASTGIATGDPAISITITDHTAAPITVGGKLFDYEVVDNGANSALSILREINYNLSLDATYQGKDPFNWPDIVKEVGGNYETEYDRVEGQDTTTTFHGFYISRSGADHPDFTRYQSNDGTYYTVPVTANASIATIVSGSRARIYNETTATETYNDIPGTSYSQNYTDGTTYSAGDVITIYITQSGATTAQIPYSTTAVASSSGWSVIASQEADGVYASYGIDGSTVTKFTADYIDDEIDVSVASNFTGQELYAWTVYVQTTSQGIHEFFGAVTAIDEANVRLNTSINLLLDNTTTTNLYQTDNIRIYREDGARPVKDPTTGGGGIDVNWREKVFIAETGVSGLTGPESAQLFGTALETTAQSILADTGDLQTNQGDWVTATGFSTPADVSASTATIQSDILNLNDISGQEAADSLIARNVKGGSDGGNTVGDTFVANRNPFSIDPVTGETIFYEEDGITEVYRRNLTLGDRDPINGAD